MIRFRLLGIPSSIHPSFWLVAFLISPIPWNLLGEARIWPFLLAWLAVVALSVLAHEVGHALTARSRGATVEITLYAMGGFTTWKTEKPVSPWVRTAIAAAGSTVGFILGGLVWAAYRSGLEPSNAVLAFAGDAFWRVNLLWGVLNWLPIRPLDGGHIFTGVLHGLFGERGTAIANAVFPITTIAAGLLGLYLGYPIVVLFALFLLMQEYRMRSSPPAAPTPAEPTSGEGERTDPESQPRFTLFGDDEAPEPGRGVERSE